MDEWELTPEQAAQGVHRAWMGGLWEEMGALQLDFLRQQGLQPSHRLLDVGCGALRAGLHFVDYLDPCNYYGIELRQTILDAGYDIELSPELRDKLPRSNLRQTDRFECDFGVEFDYAIAQSLFTHVSLNHVRLCMFRVAQQMKPGGRFFVTFNQARRDVPIDGVIMTSKTPKYGEKNIYWYYLSDLRWAAKFSPWKLRLIGDWGHPRDQQMLELTRTDVAPEFANRQTKRADGRLRRAVNRRVRFSSR